jgi:L-ascorbate metabolism protein UlaG (beta-lactamase superfamily)
MTRAVYLKPNVLAEPLFNQWYAWPYLIPPATAAMYIANFHLKIMQSFVATPQVHIAALKNPAMMGGPFINYDVNRVDEIRALLEKTRKEQTPMLALAEAVKSTNEMLLSEANGYSLEGLYPKVPEILKGYVELTYDLNNQPSVRFIEALLYKSPFYDTKSQSIALALAEKDERSFVFSTPRLENPHRLTLPIPFASTQLDELFKMRYTPQPLGWIKEVLGVKDSDEELFATFFTADVQSHGERYAGDDIRIRYLGHACLLVETREVSILCDPVISYNDGLEVDRYTYADLPQTIDYAVITHNHQDHCMFETLLQLRHKIKQIVVPKSNCGRLEDPSLKMILQTMGFSNVAEMDELETLEVADGSITSLPFFGEHADLAITTKTAYMIHLKERTIVCAADSNNIEPKLYEHLHKLFGNVDIVFLGMECDGAPLTWLYGPLLTRPLARKLDQSRRFDGSDYAKGIALISQLQPGEAYVYAMGQEPWLSYLTSIRYTDESRPIVESNKLVADCRSRGIVSERLYCKKELFLTSTVQHTGEQLYAEALV